MCQFSEQFFIEKSRERTIKQFLNMLETYDKEISNAMIIKGYRRINKACRTVLFTFGEVTFYRNRWYKNGKCYVPIDDYLKLQKYSRYSNEFMYLIAYLAVYMPYRKVVDVIKLVYNIHITKDTVLKACCQSEKLFDEKKDYCFNAQNKTISKKNIDILYIEGDGIVVKSTELGTDKRRIELAHFVVHEGIDIHHNRRRLLNKKNFISTSYAEAKRELIDYVYNTYDITDKTLLITNSDNGTGYSIRMFKELAKDIHVKKHEHFVDRYHINEKISKVYKELPQDLKHSLFTSISDANKELFNALLTTTEALIANEKDENELEAFIEFSDYLRSIFCYIIPANKRGLDIIECIGIMESQQRQISYRMKHKGMYWSESGARRMAKMIISVSQETFRELFFGNWREEFDKYTMYEDVTAELIFQALHEETEPTYYGKIANENIRKFINMLS